MVVDLCCQPQELSGSEDAAVIIEQVLSTAANVYGLTADYEVSVLLTNNATIQELNREYRNKDAATDVLSFALNEGEPCSAAADIYEGKLLGDIVISLEMAASQALDYGHSLQREVAFLAIHGLLHLLGYDHETEPKRLEMRTQEELLLERLALTR